MVIVVETLMFYLLIPAYTVLIFGISSKQGFLSICACFVVICHLFWFVPELGGKRSLSKAEKASGIALSLYSQNVT
jgi:hypothetical protein